MVFALCRPSHEDAEAEFYISPPGSLRALTLTTQHEIKKASSIEKQVA